MNLTEIETKLITNAMAILNKKQKEYNYRSRGIIIPSTNSEKTVKKFIQKRLKQNESDHKIYFEGTYKYEPQLWKLETDSDFNKIARYIADKNTTQ